MFLIEDATHNYWNVDSKTHKLIIKFIQLENGSTTKKIIKTFIDVEEFRNLMSIIKDSKFVDIYKTKKGIVKKFFGGSNHGLAKKRTPEGLKAIINGMEARILSYELKKKDGNVFFRVSAAVSDGKKGRNGTIVFTNSNRDQLYYDFGLEDINAMANTVLEYLRARQVVALNSYFNPDQKDRYVKFINLLKEKVGKEKYNNVLKNNYIQEENLNNLNIDDYKKVISELKKTS
jgi:hypothetical protein